MSINWDAVCTDPLWDTQFSWNTSTPRLTRCFESTLLVWIPPIYFLLFLPILIRSLIKSTQRFNWNPYNAIRQFISTSLVIVALADLIIVIIDRDSLDLAGLTIFNATIRFLFTLILAILFYLFVRKAVYSSGIAWAYLGLSLISHVLQLTNGLLIEDGEFRPRAHTTLFIITVLTFVLFAQGFIADHQTLYKEKEEKKNEWPKGSSSFASRLTYSWYSSLTYLGWRRPIVNEDVWLTRQVDSCLYNYKRFRVSWLRQERQQIQNGKRPKVGIVGLIWNTNWYYFATGAIFKLFNDTAIFISPLIMKKLMNFVSESSEQTWHGYFYSFGFVFISLTQLFSVNYYFNRMMIFGTRVRTQLTGAIYRKSLNLSSKSRSKFTIGQIVNLMAVDANIFIMLSTFINLLWSAPFQIIVSLSLLWSELGVAVLGGFFIMIILIPINGYLTSISKKYQSKQMKLKDERVKSMNEILNGVKIIKLYGWENAFIDKIQSIRVKELGVLRKMNYLSCFLVALWTLAPFLVSFITFTIYVLIDSENKLTPQKAFVSLAYFNILRFPMSMLPAMVTMIIQASVSVKRINRFLSGSELTDYIEESDDKENCIELKNCSFAWSKPDEVDIDEQNKKKKKEEKKNKNKKDKEPPKEEEEKSEDRILLRNINMTIKKNSFVAIVGNVGSGKSSILNAILGNMVLIEGNIRKCKSMQIAYTAQESWIQNNTLRGNILFGKEFDEDRYQKVCHACSLLPDFGILPGGDMTEIGEKGINLSGGQKQRVSLARACYSDADIYLLDDPLAAVDSHVGKHIFENIIHSKTGLLRGKTRILVTNNLSVLPFADTIFVLQNGQITESGTYSQLIEENNYFANLIRQYSSSEQNNSDDVPVDAKGATVENTAADAAPSTSNFTLKKLVEKEEAQTGRVKVAVYIRYMKALTTFWCLFIVISYIAANVCGAMANIWLSNWSRKTGTITERSTTVYYLLIYGLIGSGQGLFNSLGWLSLTKGVLKAARSLHNKMLGTIFRSPMSFFDVTPLGRILNRFSKDVDVCDVTIQTNIRVMLMCLLSTITVLVVISSELAIFLALVIPMIFCFYFIQRLYIETARQLKRLESISKSPVYSHFSETLSGVSTIRAYSVIDQFIDRNDHNVDHNNSSFLASAIANRWLSIRLESIANLIVLFSAIFSVVYREKLDASTVGLVITYALSTTQNLSFLVRSTTDIETNIVGVERILEYTDLNTEADWVVESKAPAQDWPKGEIEFVNYATRYREGLELVLKGISAKIRAGEKIGIVGRTGAGKSSLTLALFRLIEPASGTIVIDGVDISKLGLHQLRQRLTIIPQDPVLFSGTIRTNIDPFNDFTDQELWSCLELAHLKPFVSSLNSGLDYAISEGGGNISIGQRQLICLARALLRKTKILILDEATAAVDMETDSLIQKTIRSAFSDCTILTIAHRLNTIMDSDRVLVLSEGQIIEFDSPEVLLQNSDSHFYSMAEAAGLTKKQ